jgi:hypothetical protein
MTTKDEKDLENASPSEESPSTQDNTGSSDDEESSDEEAVEPSEDEESQNAPKSEEEFIDDLEKERKRLGEKIDKERKKRIDAEKSRDDVLSEVDRKIQESEKRVLRTQVIALAESMSGSQAERDLIILHYDNDIVPSGDIREDLEKARAIANRKRVSGELSELSKSVASKQNRGGSSGAGAPKEVKRQPKYSQEVIDAAQFAGVTPEEFVKKQEQH